MHPLYPIFKPVGLDDKKIIEGINSKFEPYSDFNFVSLYSWGKDTSAEYSILNGNIIIRIPAYTENRLIYSIMGKNEINESLEKLVAITDTLEFVPEFTARLIDKNTYAVKEDLNNFDYIYKTSNLAKLDKNDQKNKQKKLRKFIRNFHEVSEVRQVDLSPKNQKLILDLYDEWNQAKTEDKNSDEKKAIKRLFDCLSEPNLTMVFFLYINNRLVGFSINELLNNTYAICHFHKTTTSLYDADIFFSTKEAELLNLIGVHNVNWEQDLGIPGLRQSKLSYAPEKFLKKYIIVKK